MTISNRDLDFSRSDLLLILDIIDICLRATAAKEGSIDRVMALFRDLVPYEAALIGSADIQEQLPLNEPNILNFGFDNEWLSMYKSRRYEQIDPVIKLTLGSGSAVNWKDVIHGKENIDPSFYSLKQEFSLFNGIACGYVNRTDNSDVCQAVMMTMSLPPTKFSYRYNYIIERILPHLLMIRSNAANELTCNENILSTRELEVLRWVKEGKSSWEIGEILSISERTVKFHLSNIFRKLNVISRAQAVAKSLQYGYLEL